MPIADLVRLHDKVKLLYRAQITKEENLRIQEWHQWGEDAWTKSAGKICKWLKEDTSQPVDQVLCLLGNATGCPFQHPIIILPTLLHAEDPQTIPAKLRHHGIPRVLGEGEVANRPKAFIEDGVVHVPQGPRDGVSRDMQGGGPCVRIKSPTTPPRNLGTAGDKRLSSAVSKTRLSHKPVRVATSHMLHLSAAAIQRNGG